MKHKALVLVALAAATFGIATATILNLTRSPALADRPGPGGRPAPVRPSSGSNRGPSSGSSGSSGSSRPAPAQATRRSGVIDGSSPETRVYVYAQPNSTSQTVGYAFDGDPVYVYDNAGGGSAWSYVEFSETGARGWVPSGSVNFNTSDRG
jgi:hypothetical protein